MTTVLIANGIMDAGGTETLIMEILRHKSGMIRYVMLVHYIGEVRKGTFDDEIMAMGVPMIYIPSIGTVGVGEYLKAFDQIVGKLGKIDIIHSHLNANGGIIALAAHRNGIRVRICHCHADIIYSGNWFCRAMSEARLWILKAIIAHYATDFWACSDEAWNRLFYKNKKRVIISNMIDVPKYLSSQERKESAKSRWHLTSKYVVGSVGRVAPVKNYEFVLRIVSELNKTKEAHFICFGRFNPDDTYSNQLLALAKCFGISDRVHFVGNSNNISEDIHCIDVFLMTSLTEGFGMAAIEAQAAGLPTLLSNSIPSKVDVGLGLVSFLPLNNSKAWVDAIEMSKSLNIPNDVILRRFEDVGYNASTSVADIESRYLHLTKR